MTETQTCLYCGKIVNLVKGAPDGYADEDGRGWAIGEYVSHTRDTQGRFAGGGVRYHWVCQARVRDRGPYRVGQPRTILPHVVDQAIIDNEVEDMKAALRDIAERTSDG